MGWLFVILLNLNNTSAAPSYAEDLIRITDGRVWIENANCATFDGNLSALKTWTESTSASCTIQNRTVKESLCSADIHDCLPEHVKKYQGVKAEFNGPNCWNLALVMKGLLPHLRKSSPEEMTFYMNSDLCHKLDVSEAPQPGDIGAIRTKNCNPSESSQSNSSCEIHGFIYVSPDLVYSKNSEAKESPYALQSRSVVYQYYDAEDSKKTVDFYRCSSITEFLRENAARINPDLIQAFDAIKTIDCYTQRTAISNNVFAPIQIQHLLAAAEILRAYTKSAKHTAKTKEEKFAMEALELRQRVLSEQFYYFLYKMASHSNVNAIQRGFPMRRLGQIFLDFDDENMDAGF